MKKGLIFGALLLSLFLTRLASALSFSETLSFIDPTLLTLAIVFVIAFGVLYFSVSKIFKGNKAISAVIAIALSFLIVYWVNNLVSLATLFSGWGISDETLYTVGPILLLALIIFLFVKLKLAGVCLILGGIFILAGITGLVYSTDIAIIIGIVLAVIGLIALLKKKGKIKFSGPRENWVSSRQAARNRESPARDYNARNYNIQHERERIAEQQREIARANAMRVAGEDYAREERRRRESMEALERERTEQQRAEQQREEERAAQQQRQMAQEQQQEKFLQKQIGSDINSLIRTYNEIQRQNPSDPRLMEIANEVKRLRHQK